VALSYAPTDAGRVEGVGIEIKDLARGASRVEEEQPVGDGEGVAVIGAAAVGPVAGGDGVETIGAGAGQLLELDDVEFSIASL